MPNCFSASSVLTFLMSAIFVACFYVTFPSLTLTKRDKTTDFKDSWQLLQLFLKSSPTACSIAYKTAQGWERWGRKKTLHWQVHCMGQVLGCCWSREGWETAARTRTLVQLKVFTGGVGGVAAATLWTWKLCSWGSFLRKWALPPGIWAVLCRALGQEKMDALLGCKVWKQNLVLCNNLAFKKRLSLVGSFCRECKLHTNTHIHTPLHGLKSFKQYSKHSQDFQLLSQLNCLIQDHTLFPLSTCMSSPCFQRSTVAYMNIDRGYTSGSWQKKAAQSTQQICSNFSQHKRVLEIGRRKAQGEHCAFPQLGDTK